MLKLATKVKDIDLYQLACVYRQSIENAAQGKSSLQLLDAQQDFYGYVSSFFQDVDTLYAVWYENGIYCSAARLEPYKDGYLLSGLETDPRFRVKGYADLLIKGLLAFCVGNGKLPVYSHIDNRNNASIRLHCKNGFQECLDYAVFIDGSVDHKSKTYRYKI